MDGAEPAAGYGVLANKMQWSKLPKTMMLALACQLLFVVVIEIGWVRLSFGLHQEARRFDDADFQRETLANIDEDTIGLYIFAMVLSMRKG